MSLSWIHTAHSFFGQDMLTKVVTSYLDAVKQQGMSRLDIEPLKMGESRWENDLPSGKLTVCYGKWPIDRWFTY